MPFLLLTHLDKTFEFNTDLDVELPDFHSIRIPDFLVSKRIDMDLEHKLIVECGFSQSGVSLYEKANAWLEAFGDTLIAVITIDMEESSWEGASKLPSGLQHVPYAAFKSATTGTPEQYFGPIEYNGYKWAGSIQTITFGIHRFGKEKQVWVRYSISFPCRYLAYICYRADGQYNI